MVSYEKAEKILFSADAFGKFGALSRCGFDSSEDDDWACEARRYYFNIVGKYGGPVQTLLKKLSAVEISTICPLHGPVLKDDLGEYIRLYDIWSSYGVETEGVFIACASIHGNTLKVAEKLAEMLQEKGVKVAFNDLTRDDSAEAIEDAFRYGTLVLAASSYDAGLFPPAAEFIAHLQDKSWQNRRVGLIENGSWAPSAGRVMKEKFSAMKNVTVLEPLVTIRSAMKDSDLPALETLCEALLS
jgi:flavorubredoxin